DRRRPEHHDRAGAASRLLALVGAPAIPREPANAEAGRMRRAHDPIAGLPRPESERGEETREVRRSHALALLRPPRRMLRRAAVPASRIKSPSTVTVRAVPRIQRPGNVASHHAVSMYCRPSASIPPQDGMLAGIPTPRKLRLDSATMA